MSRLASTLALLTFALGGCDPEAFEPLLEGGGHSEAPVAEFDVDLEDEHDLDLDVDPCESHCRGYANHCRESFAYASYDQCESLCASWDDVDDGLDRAQCRIDGMASVLAASSEADRAAACDDIGPDSTPCGSAFVLTCERYCDTYVPACVLHDGYFLNRASCMTWCDAMPMGTEGSTKDTIACRSPWAELAEGNPASFCDEAGPDSGVCN